MQPKNAATTVGKDGFEWSPTSFQAFLEEVDHVTRYFKQAGGFSLFRGHRSRDWILDSTFARSVKGTLFSMTPGQRWSKRIAESGEFASLIANLYLLKYGIIVTPCQELHHKSRELELDPWFELMKRYQQYPGDDAPFLRGTNILDWTKSLDVAIYFANYERQGDGSVYVCNPALTGKTLQVIPVGDILNKMREATRAGMPLGRPLIFCPPRQIKNQRAKNQQAIYIAQMDLRYDLETMWRQCENEDCAGTIVLKIVLPTGTEREVNDYLSSRGITDGFIFPPEPEV